MAKQKKQDDLSSVDLEWLFERITRGIANRLQENLREIVRDEMARVTASGGPRP